MAPDRPAGRRPGARSPALQPQRRRPVDRSRVPAPSRIAPGTSEGWASSTTRIVASPQQAGQPADEVQAGRVATIEREGAEAGSAPGRRIDDRGVRRAWLGRAEAARPGQRSGSGSGAVPGRPRAARRATSGGFGRLAVDVGRDHRRVDGAGRRWPPPRTAAAAATGYGAGVAPTVAADRVAALEVLAAPGAQRPVEADQPVAVRADPVEPGPAGRADQPLLADPPGAGRAVGNGVDLVEQGLFGQGALGRLGRSSRGAGSGGRSGRRRRTGPA